ncbi:MAG TPA: glycosyltransferase [Acetobacteraceae bacterium]|nr:glycosyltransferase [Acetobacteraceae bacterium]
MAETEVRASIIMPAYNAARTLEQAIGSALRQTERRVEVLVIDDASTDATADIAAGFATADARVRLLRQPINRGPAAARNLGMQAARGAWTALLDADDQFAPERLETLIAMGESHGADIVADNLLLCPEGEHEHASPMLAPALLPEAKWMSAAEFVAGNVGSRYTPRISYGFLQPLIRRRFLQTHRLRYEEKNRFGEDYLFALNCLLRGARWWITPLAMYFYRVQSGTLTEVQSAADLSRIGAYEAALLRSHPVVAADPSLAAALRRHKRVMEHFYYYRAFTDALKARSFMPAASLLLESAHSFRHIIAESAMQAPRVALKALRGGFRQSRSAQAVPAAAGIPHDLPAPK